MSSVATREKGTSEVNVESILKRLRGVRANRNGWTAVCPAHDDGSPSLAINHRNGKILLYCHAGCSIEAVCAGLGINISELFNESRQAGSLEPRLVRVMKQEIAPLRGRLTPRDREREVTVIATNRENVDFAIARALALAVEGEIVQIALREGAK